MRTPTLKEFIESGYAVTIQHNRRHRIVFFDDNTKKLIIKTTENYPKNDFYVSKELLPKGGMTEVWVVDPETSAEFYGYGKCNTNENYNKSVGITKALERITQLMLVCDGKNGFTMKIEV